VVEYPLGHRRRRKEGIPQLNEKFKNNLAARFSEKRVGAILELFAKPQKLEQMPVHEFINFFVAEQNA
jgi:2-methylcitrate dehydratase